MLRDICKQASKGNACLVNFELASNSDGCMRNICVAKILVERAGFVNPLVVLNYGSS